VRHRLGRLRRRSQLNLGQYRVAEPRTGEHVTITMASSVSAILDSESEMAAESAAVSWPGAAPARPSNLKTVALPFDTTGMQRAILACVTIALVCCVTGVRLSGWTGLMDDPQVVWFARQAATQSLTFQQGDRQTLEAARRLFTDDGWKQFLKDLTGWLDANGAPTFTSSFVPSTNGRVVDEHDGIIHVRIPGTLTQSAGVSKTTYRRFAVDVWVGGSPVAVQRLTQTTCAGSSTACQ